MRIDGHLRNDGLGQYEHISTVQLYPLCCPFLGFQRPYGRQHGHISTVPIMGVEVDVTDTGCLVDDLVGGLEHFLFFHILGIIIPTDCHIFQSGRYTTNQ